MTQNKKINLNDILGGIQNFTETVGRISGGDYSTGHQLVGVIAAYKAIATGFKKEGQVELGEFYDGVVKKFEPALNKYFENYMK